MIQVLGQAERKFTKAVDALPFPVNMTQRLFPDVDGGVANQESIESEKSEKKV
jgi:hypothetical protein